MKRRQFTSNLMKAMVLAGLPLELTAFQNCSGVGFSSNSNSSDGGGSANGTLTQNGCSSQLREITSPVKIIISMDMSGSNIGLYTTGLDPSLATDPQKTMRMEALQRFFAQYGGKTNFSWHMNIFQSSYASALINGGNSTTPAFSGSASQMGNAINNFYGMQDGGQTPYKATLAMISQLISSDSASADTKYIVVFISDGMPTDYVSNGTQSADQLLDQDVQSLVNLKPGQISLNTVFYGSVAPDAGPRLQTMASLGKGQFLDASSSTTFDINDVVTVPGTKCTNT